MDIVGVYLHSRSHHDVPLQSEQGHVIVLSPGVGESLLLLDSHYYSGLERAGRPCGPFSTLGAVKMSHFLISISSLSYLDGIDELFSNLLLFCM